MALYRWKLNNDINEMTGSSVVEMTSEKNKKRNQNDKCFLNLKNKTDPKEEGANFADVM